MRHLAIETSTSVIDMALMEEDRLLCSVCVPRPGGASEILVHGLDSLLALSGTKKDDIGLISSSEGPGTYTSLRVGHLFCRGLSFGLGIGHRTVSPFLILAEQARPLLTPEVEYLVVLLDARRNEVNAALFSLKDQEGSCWKAEPGGEGPFSGKAVDPARVLDALPAGSGLITGPGTGPVSEILFGEPVRMTRIRILSDLPRSETMGRLAWERERSGTAPSAGPLFYGRDSVIF